RNTALPLQTPAAAAHARLHLGSVKDQPKQLSGISRHTVRHHPKTKCQASTEAIQTPSAPGTTRTCDLGIRRPLLYPPELRRQCAGQSIQLDRRSSWPTATRAKRVPAPE